MPILETPSVVPATTLIPPSSVSTIPPVSQQATKPIPTPLITIKAPSIKMIPDLLQAVIQRVYDLEKDVQDMGDKLHKARFNQMVSAVKDLLTFDELMATPIDFSKYAMNRLKIDNLTQVHLVGSFYELLKGTCTSSIELEYNMEECFKALTDKLDWNNP
nr:hypothetical protein [Tanacetum cinerariifolium]